MSANNIAEMEREIERLEAAANGSWHGLRVSADFMREKAREATDRELEKMENMPEFMRAVRTDAEIKVVERWIMEIDATGSHYPRKSYEEGVQDMLEWLRGDTDLPPYETD